MPIERSKSAYFPHVDGLRAIAVVAVVLYHLNNRWLPGGFAGVDVFFVISGFIVSASVGSLDRVGLLKFIPFFYARRLQRIGPALAVFLLVSSLVAALIIPAAWLSQSNQKTGLYAFFGLSNLILARTNNDYFSPIADFNPFTHTWSLGVEEQFYFVFPILFFAWTFRGRWRWLTVGTFALGVVASLAYSAWLGHTDKTYAYYMATSRFWQLGAGVLLYQLMTLSGRRFDVPNQPSPKWFTVGAFLSLVVLGYAFVVSKPDSFPFPGAIPAVVGAVGLLGFLHGKDRKNPIMLVLASRPVLFVGRISYSLYLWHWPVFVFFRWTVGMDTPAFQAAATLLAFGLAVGSYYFVETPFRHLRALRAAPRIAVVVYGLAAMGTAAWAAQKINNVQPRISLTTVARHAKDWYPEDTNMTDAAYPGCTVGVGIASVGNGFATTFSRSNCGDTVTAPRIFAIGDSHAVDHELMFKKYALATGAPVMLYNNGGCPFMSLQPWREDDPACRANAAAALADMLPKLRPGDVVFLPSLRLPRYADQWVRFPDAQVKDAVFSDWAVKERDTATQAAADVLREFAARRTHVVIEAPPPVFKSPPFRCAEGYERTNPICRDGTMVDREELEQLRKPAMDALDKLATTIPDVSLWDPFAILCPTGPNCSAFLDGRPLFFDGDHISGYGNRLLFPSFMALVSRPAPTE
jgi:peptidoglycan/LPS O-acetylase OafA/YrhL